MARAVRKHPRAVAQYLIGGLNMSNASADRSDRLASAHADLVTAVESLTSGDDWQRMLEMASRFHRYSANNVFLIMLQQPDATRVAGYRAWQSMDRQVRKGERGIRILAPCQYRYKVTDDDGTETSHVGIRGFTTATVFDVSQTDGEDLPDIRPELLEGDDVAGLWDALSAQVKKAGYTVERGDCNGANGRTDHGVHTVRVRNDVSDAQAAKTLAHELAHVLLHPDTAAYFQCRGRSEVEAESVAYLVCHAAGLATDGYSWPYLAHWSDGNAEVVQETAGRVLEAARSILAGLGADEDG
jgi:antirestriction protein ArdC